MTTLQKIELRRSEIRQRLGQTANMAAAERVDEIKAEEAALLAEMRDLEGQMQAAMVAEDQDGRLRGGQVVADGATRERAGAARPGAAVRILDGGESRADGARRRIRASGGGQCRGAGHHDGNTA